MDLCRGCRSRWQFPTLERPSTRNRRSSTLYWLRLSTSTVKMRSVLLLLVGTFAALYFGAAAYVCHFEIGQLLFPAVAWAGVHDQQSPRRLSDGNGNTLLMRQYGSPRVGCVVFFPGQHGGVARYQRDLFPAYAASGLAVFALSYPGQDQAPGRTKLGEIQILSRRALDVVGETCPLSRTVLVGRSLGSMLAAYATQGIRPAGLVLEAAAPSLSSAILVRLRSRWYLSPLACLPVSKLLPHDYSLAEALTDTPSFPVAVFQGTADEQTPIRLLRPAGAIPARARLVPVPGGTHSDTYRLVLKDYVEVALRMIRRGSAKTQGA